MQIEQPTSRIMRAASPPRGAICAITALACAALLSACGSSSSSTEGAKANVDTAKVALSIEQTLAVKRHVKSTVTCPAPMPAVPGSTFECVALVQAAKAPHTVTREPFVVTVQSSRGYVTYAGK
jgi:hypothetical protein